MAKRRAKPVSRVEALAARLERIRRPWRILLGLLITLELVVLASLVIDRLLIDRVIEGQMGRMTPALVAVALGLVFYGVGWWALVGFDVDPDQPWQAGRPAVYYVALGVGGLILLLMLVLFGLLYGYRL